MRRGRHGVFGAATQGRWRKEVVDSGAVWVVGRKGVVMKAILMGNGGELNGRVEMRQKIPL